MLSASQYDCIKVELGYNSDHHDILVESLINIIGLIHQETGEDVVDIINAARRSAPNDTVALTGQALALLNSRRSPTAQLGIRLPNVLPDVPHHVQRNLSYWQNEQNETRRTEIAMGYYDFDHDSNDFDNSNRDYAERP